MKQEKNYYKYDTIFSNDIKKLEEYLEDGWNIVTSLDNKVLLLTKREPHQQN